MLIETPYKEGDTVSLKLSSGEEVISRLDKETDEEITLIKPMMLVVQQQGMGLAPFMFSVATDAKIKLSKSNVLCVSKTAKEIADQYTTQTTGIQMATA
jgi:hypothetical protein